MTSEAVPVTPDETRAQCEKHDRELGGYPCSLCHEEWRAANPNTSAAIARLTTGKGSPAAVRKAQLEDRKGVSS